MLSELEIREAVEDAISAYTLETGKRGLTKTELRRNIYALGGDEDDYRRAMIAGLAAMAEKDSLYLN